MNAKPFLALALAAMLILCLAACAPPSEDTSIVGEYRTFDNVYTIGAYSSDGNYMTYTGSTYRITEDGKLLLLGAEEEWISRGTLVPWELTEDNFDALIPQFDAIDGAWNTYDELYELREQAVKVWKSQTIKENALHTTDMTYYYYVLQTRGGTVLIAEGFHTTGEDLSSGYIAKITCVIPVAEDTAEAPLEPAEYVEGQHIYTSPTANTLKLTSEDAYIYRIEDGLFSIYTRQTQSLWDAFVLDDRVWEPFPFSQEEWDAMTISGSYGDAWELVQDSRYMELSLQFFLLEKDGQLYICRGTHDPASGTSHIQSIYALTTEGSETDTWTETFGWYERHINEIIAANTDENGELDLENADLTSLTVFSDQGMVLRYCFTRFLTGNETGDAGQVMAEVCKEILNKNGESDIISHTYTNGQNWFDQYNEQAMGYLNTLGANTLWYVKKHLALN